MKLLDTLRADESGRFKILGEGNELKVKGVIHLNDAAFQQQFEEWRAAIAQHIAEVGHPVELGELGFRVKRPPALKGVSLQQLLVQDPRRRFALSGRVNHVRVGLATRIKAPQEMRSGLRPGIEDFGRLPTLGASKVCHGRSYSEALKSGPASKDSSPPSTPLLLAPPPGFERTHFGGRSSSDDQLLSGLHDLSLHSAFDFLLEQEPADSPVDGYCDIRLMDWLPVVFADCDPQAVSMFSARLIRDAGFVSVQDLLDAKQAGYLTAEFIGNISGMRIGHYTRLMAALADLQARHEIPAHLMSYGS